MGTPRSPRVQINDCSGALRRDGWTVAAINTPLRMGQHQLRLQKGDEMVYSTPILASPLECWRRAVHDLLGADAQPRRTTGGREHVKRAM